MGRLLDRLQSLGSVPVVNPRRGKLPGVEPVPDRPVQALALGLTTLLVLGVAMAVTIAFGDSAGGFIYANF